MDEFGDSILPKAKTALGRLAHSIDHQPGLFPERISLIHEYKPNGADIAFFCSVESGDQYFAKQDSFGKDVRATELFCSLFARRLDINVPDFAVLEDNSGQTFFGSKNVFSTASVFDAKYLLTQKSMSELGQPLWIGQFLSKLYAFDLLFFNDDRCINNFLMTKDGMRKNLYAMDFANARLSELTNQRILLDSSTTMRDAKLLRSWHGFDKISAMNLVENIGRLDQRFVEDVLDTIPEDWLDKTKRKSICAAWSEGHIQTRIEALRRFFTDGKRI